MKSYSVYIIVILILILHIISYGSLSAKEKTVTNPNIYFPLNDSISLVYKSEFGESITKHFQDGEFTVSSSEADRFTYRQTLMINEDGVYAKEIYQYFQIFLFINKEEKFIYEQPLLRFPLPLLPGTEWEWEGVECSDGDMDNVKVTGKVLDKEFVITEAGIFEAIKLESIIEGSANTRNKVTEWYAEGVGLIKVIIIIEGGGVMGFLRDILGFGTIEFELKEIRKL